MSWMSKLCETYDNCDGQEGAQPWPLSHMVKNAHIEVVLDSLGNFKSGRARILSGDESPTLIPTTESSAGRAGAKIAPHPLCEELSYCAMDLPQVDKEKVDSYLSQLEKWCNSEFCHPKVKIVYSYLQKNILWQDLLGEISFPITFKNKSGQASKILPEKTFIRWRIEEESIPCSGTWEDRELINNWIFYDEKFNNSIQGFCFVEGSHSRAARNHSRFLRNSGDGAKLVSSNDDSGFTFRGRFIEPSQSAEIGFNVTQKAHNALRWLISRQGYRNGDQVVIAWAPSGKPVPPVLKDVYDTLLDLDDFSEFVPESSDTKYDEGNPGIPQDMGMRFSNKLSKKIAGYRTNLSQIENIIIMALDSATPGRMSITFYREYFAKEFLDQLEAWYKDFAWLQRYIKQNPDLKKHQSKEVWLIGTPTPKIIAEAAYGKTLTDTLKKNIVERILPCIVNGKQIPFDIVNLCINQASHPNSSDNWEWQRNIGVACSLFRGYYKRHSNKNLRKDYPMGLDIENKSRDYLYGRLLAVAEYIEQIALNLAGEKRDTNAKRLMQRFADYPFSTWRNIEGSLGPSMQRLQNTRRGFLINCQKELDAIMSAFKSGDFTNDTKLSGEFLLAYHCQRHSYNKKLNNDQETE